MPWRALSVIDTRREFIRLALSGKVSVLALCQRFGSSMMRSCTPSPAARRPRPRRACISSKPAGSGCD